MFGWLWQLLGITGDREQRELVILSTLSDGKSWHALDILRRNPAILNENTIFVELSGLVSQGFLEMRRETDEEMGNRSGPKRVLYQRTGKRREVRSANESTVPNAQTI